MKSLPLPFLLEIGPDDPSRLTRLWGKLTLPHPSIREPERRRRVRVLSSLLLVLVLLGVATLLWKRFANGPVINYTISSAEIVILAVAYVFSRTKYCKVALTLTVLTILVSSFLGAVIDHDPRNLYFVICIALIGSLILSPGDTILISAGAAAMILLLPTIMPQFDFVEIANPALFVILTGALATMAAWIQLHDIRYIEMQSRELSASLIKLADKQQALQQSEALLQLQIDLMPIACIVRDTQYCTTSWNPAARKIFGFSEEEVLGKQLYELIVPEAAKAHVVEEIWSRLLEGDSTAHSVNENLTKDGRVILCEWSNTPLKDRDGKVVGVLSMVQDITKRKRAEEELSASEERYRNLFKRIPVALYRTTPSGQFLDANPALVELLGYPNRETLMGVKVQDIYVNAEDRVRGNQALERDGIVRESQFQVKRYDGRAIWVRDTSRIVQDPQKRVLYYEGSLQDVTEQIEAEQTVRRSTARNKAISDISQWIVEAGMDYQAILDGVTRRVAGMIGDTCFASLLSEDGEYLQLASIFTSQPEVMKRIQEMESPTRCRLGEGVAGRVAQTGRTICLEEIPQEEVGPSGYLKTWPSLEKPGSSVLIVPMRAQDHLTGTFGVLREKPSHPFNEDDQILLQEIADWSSLAIANAQLFVKAQHNLSKVQALRQIDIAITGSVDLRISLGTILEKVISHLEVDAANVLQLNHFTLTLDYATGRGFRTEALQHTHLRLGEGYAGIAAIERKTVFIPDLRNRGTDLLRSPLLQTEGFVSYYGAPLIAKGQVKGVLEVFQRSPLNPSPEWKEFLEALAGQAAIAIDNASLFNDLQHSNQELILAYDATIEGWSHALDLRDNETEGHTRRVTELTLRLAREMGVSGAELVHVRRGALLHDIGKMGIPDKILLKEGPLTEEEWVVMRKHPGYAYEMLTPITYLRPALDIPYYHHEKWDGSGYPRKIKGEQIPKVARIFAVVDVWDALRSDRPYRAAWKEAEVLAYIREQSGRHFDPDVVEVFLNAKPWANS